MLGEGWPTFNDWPHYADLLHQRVDVNWLRQAHQKGLNLVVAIRLNSVS